MRHISFSIFVLLTALSANGFASNQYNLCPEKSAINITGGYFFFSDAKMRKIYDQGGLDVRVTGSFPIGRCFHLYGSVEYLEKYGRSLNAHQKTKIWEVPLSLGLKTVVPLSQKIQYYLTLGPRYFFVHAHNNSSFVDRNMSQNGLGGFANMGFTYCTCRHLLVDVFGEYSYGRMHFHSSTTNSFGQSVQVGGFAFGGGLSYVF